MAANYFDPSTALPDPSVYAQHGPFGISMPSFLGTQAAANRRETVAPFLQRAGQEDALNLQKLQTDTSEYTGPEATALRSQKRRTETATSAESEKTAPFEGAWTRGDFQNKTALQPLNLQEQQAEIHNKITTAKDQPRVDYLGMVGARRDAIAKAKTPFEENEIRRQIDRQWEQKYPGKTAPNIGTQPLKQFADHAYDAMVHTANHEQEMAKGAQTQQGATTRTGMEQTGQTQRSEATLAAARTPEQIANWGRDQLRRKNLKPQERSSIENQIDQANDAIAEAETNKQYRPIDATTPLILSMTAQAQAKALGLSPEETGKAMQDALPNYQRARDARKAELLKGRGFTMTYLRGVNPDKSDAQIRSEAKKRGVPIVE